MIYLIFFIKSIAYLEVHYRLTNNCLIIYNPLENVRFCPSPQKKKYILDLPLGQNKYVPVCRQACTYQ